MTWTLWSVYVLSVVFFFLHRRYLQRKYLAQVDDLNEPAAVMDLPDRYFFQLPLVRMVDGMPIQIIGKRPCIFELQFHRRLHKVITFLGIDNLTGVELKSSERIVTITPIEFFTVRDVYEVFVDGAYYGHLQSKRLLKEKGIKKSISFTFDSPFGTISIENNYIDPELRMTRENEQVFIAKRNVMTLEKSVYSGKRGEQHEIRIQEQEIDDEVLLAIYLALMNKRNQ